MNHLRMSRAEVGLLVGIAAFAAATFLPVTHDVSLAGVSLIAWMMWALMIGAPAFGLALALRDRNE